MESEKGRIIYVILLIKNIWQMKLEVDLLQLFENVLFFSLDIKRKIRTKFRIGKWEGGRVFCNLQRR